MTDFNIDPYWDDFEATNGAKDKNYMRIMFRPGYSVQARELTQIQSILQNQIKQFGDHVFQDGSPVTGGQLSLDTSVTYVKVEKQYNGQDVDLTDFVGLTVFNTGTPRSRARVIQSDIPAGTDDRVLMVKYLRGNGFQAAQTITTTAGLNANTGAKIVSDTSFSGTGSTVSINEGVFYVDGFFVTVLPQTIVLDPYSTTPTYRVGLEIDEAFVDENEDTNLLDPAQSSFNFQAPGAARYKFNLVLAKRAIDSADDRKFFELLRVENGVITRQVSYPVYAELEKTLARRTYDESGNYTVKPFRINLSANANPDLFDVNVEPGKAYVKGFEFETIGTRSLSVPRARTFQSSKDYDLSVYYGNRVVVTDVQSTTQDGINLSATPKEVDLHCVGADQVTLDGFSQKYYATRIGTAKLKNFDREVGNDYYAYLIDVQFDSIFGAANTNSSTPNEIYLPRYFSTNSQSYVGATLTMIDRFPGESRIILAYDGAGKLARLDQPLPSNPQNGDRFSLSIPLSSTDSLVRANTTSYTSANLTANIAFDGRNNKGETVFDDNSYQTNVYELPNLYVRRSSDANAVMYLRTIRPYTAFTSNGGTTITLSADEGVFDFGTVGTSLSSAEIQENIIVVPVNGTAPGSVLDMTAAGRSVFKHSATSLSIYTNGASGSAFNSDVYITTKKQGVETLRRTKTLITSNAALSQFDNLTGTGAVVNYANVKINTTTGLVWYTAPDVINKVPGAKQSLYIPDVVKINKIYDSGNVSLLPNSTSAIDITDRFTFDSGQTDNYYGHASITLKPGVQPPAGQMVVLLDYFQHSAAKGYVSATSYSSGVYNEGKIPVYINKAGRTFNLRDCIDLRPVRTIGTSAAPTKFIQLTPRVDVIGGSANVVINANTLQYGPANTVLSPPVQTGSIIRVGAEERRVVGITNSRSIIINSGFNATSLNASVSIVTEDFSTSTQLLHRPTDPLELDYDFYLPRVDKVVVTKDKDFKVISGIPDLDPEEPLVDENFMEIYKLSIPAYTASLEAVNMEFVDNRRYTMRDIAEIDKRLTTVERFVALKEKEKENIKNPPKSGDINKPIYGLIVDEFDDLTIVDQTIDFGCSIELGKLAPYKVVTPLKLKGTDQDSNNLKDKFVSLAYTEVEMASQKIGSLNGNTQVQTAIIAKGEGFVTLSPESDFFFNLNFPPVITDFEGRSIEINQVTPNNAILGYGTGRYPLPAIEDLRITGDQVGINRRTMVRIPDPGNPLIEPRNTVEVDLNHAGVYYKRQDELWTGKPLNKTADGDPNAFDTVWNRKGFTSGGNEFNIRGFDDNRYDQE